MLERNALFVAQTTKPILHVATTTTNPTKGQVLYSVGEKTWN
jgi:hypothetical protein